MSKVSMRILVLMFLPFVRATSLEEENDVEEATAEILVVLEKNLSDSFQFPSHRHSQFCNLFQDVNGIYMNIEGVQLNIALKGLTMIKDLEDQPFVENYLVAYRGETFLNKYSIDAFRNFAERKEWVKEYDAVILLVNMTMIDASAFSLGNAFTSGFCSNWNNVAIAISDPLVIAQQIAHLLGVRCNSGVCSKDNNVMIPGRKICDKFLNCYAIELRKQLRKEARLKCLWEESAKDTAKCEPPTALKEENNVDEATAEILVVLEKNLSIWLESSSNPHSHVCKLFQDANDIYNNIDGVKVNIAVKGLKMMKDLADQPFLENYMVINRHGTFINRSCLKTFRNFAMKQKWLQEYDAVFLLVNKNLTDGRGVQVGTAFRTGLCSDWNNVAVATPDHLVIAHELAHLLGVEHDSADCSKGNYIMSPGLEERDKFSSCSENVIRKQLKKDGGLKCLWEEKAKDTAKCKPCDFLSGSESPNYSCIMKTLGLDLE